MEQESPGGRSCSEPERSLLGIVVFLLPTAPGATWTPGVLGLQAPEAHAQAGGRGRARRLGYRLLCNAWPGVLEPRARKGPRAAAGMQKYEKLEKIGEGNGTARCSCKIFFCRPFSIPCSPGSSTVSNTHRFRPQHWLQPWPLSSTLRADSSPPPASVSHGRLPPHLSTPSDPPPDLHTSCICSPSSAPLAQPHPPPASVLSADLQPLRSCGPYSSPRPLLPIFRPQKLGLCDRPPHLAPAASACWRHP